MNNTTDVMKLFFSTFVMYIPVLIVCLVAVIVSIGKWRQCPGASLWALLGFGLALLLCFVMPIGQTAIQYWAFHSGGNHTGRMWAFSVFAVIGTVLHAVIYALLLVAVFAGRSQPAPSAQPSLYRP